MRYYQHVCKEGHYIQENKQMIICPFCNHEFVWTNLVDNDIDEPQLRHVRIPLKDNKVENYYFQNHFKDEYSLQKFNKRNKGLKFPGLFGYNYPLQLIIQSYKYIDETKRLRIQFSMQKDMSNQRVPFVYISFGNNIYDVIGNSEWKTLYVDEYGEPINTEDGFGCCVWYYDCDVRSIVIDLYVQIYKRIFKYHQDQKE